VCKFAGITKGDNGRVFGILDLKFLRRYDFHQPVKNDLDVQVILFKLLIIYMGSKTMASFCS
jgi:hypothetical protein